MKIKNFKFNQKVASKRAAFLLVGTLAATMLTGCEPTPTVNRTNALKGTILENACVVTFEDGSKDIAVAVGNCDYEEYYSHYYSIISGVYFGGRNCVQDEIEGTIVHHYGITTEENITGYLTADELAKAIQGELDNDDIVAIVSRIKSDTEVTYTKAR